MLCNDIAKMGYDIAREDEWLQGMGCHHHFGGDRLGDLELRKVFLFVKLSMEK